MTYRNPAARVRGSVDSFWLVQCEKRRRVRLWDEAEQRARRRARVERVKRWFGLSRGKDSRASAAQCLEDDARQH